MIGEYRVLPAADQDLDDQAAYLAAQASLETALRFYDAASSTFGKIAGMPGIWRAMAIGQPSPGGITRLADRRP
jgi:plasmid stabilization system protein ParE